MERPNVTFFTAKQRAKGSLNPEYAKMCAGKFRHYNFLTAIQHASSIEKWDEAHGNQKKPVIYHCEFCGAEHIGHLDKAQFTFPFPSEKNERDKNIIAIVQSGKAVARQGNPTVLCPSKSISIENGRRSL
jgi:hypothetical protein